MFANRKREDRVFMRPSASTTSSSAGVRIPSASRPLDVHRWSDFPELRACLTGLVNEINAVEKRTRARTRLGDKQFRDAIRCIVLDLYVAWCADPKLEVGVSLRKASFGTGTRYNALYFTYDTFLPALRGLIALGYVEKVRKHFHDPRTGIGRSTRIRTTPKLIELLTVGGEVTLAKLCFRSDSYADEVIILRDEAKNDIEYNETTSTTQMREELERINAALAGHWLDLEVPDSRITALNAEMATDYRRGNREAPYVDFAARRLRRIFNNNDWHQGGRFYGGWWQSVPKEYRTRITINGKRTVEIDYSVMHPALMYAQVGAKLEGDAYDINVPNVKRDLIKRTFNQLVNAKGRTDAKSDFNEHECGMSWKELQERIKARHRPIARFLGTGHGLRLQNADAQIANRIMLQFLRMNYVCLPVHDSFIVHHELQDDLTKIMHDEFLKQCGAHISTKPTFDVTTTGNVKRGRVIDGSSMHTSLFATDEYAGHETRLNNWWSSRG